MQEDINLSDFGEGWINTALDFTLVSKNIPNTYPYAMFYAWSVKKDDSGIANFEISGDDTSGLIEVFCAAMKTRKLLVQLWQPLFLNL